MKFSTCYRVRVFATGFVVLTLLSIPLFWMRFLCRVSLFERMPNSIKEISIEPSGLVPPDIDEDPRLNRRSWVSANIDQDYFMCLGVFDYLMSRVPMGRRCDVFVARSEENWAYFDRASGRIICRYTQTETMPDRSNLHRQVQFYIGPEGISEIPDDALGRFAAPILDQYWPHRDARDRRQRDLILYDSKLGHFFKIDFDRATVTKGPQVSDSDRHDPIQIGWLDKNVFLMQLNCHVPRMDLSKIEPPDSPYTMGMMGHGRPREEAIQSAQYYPASPHLLVLDKSGRIDLLDKDTLEFTGIAGRLPEPRTLFGSKQKATPENTLSYRVRPLYLGARLLPGESARGAVQTPDPNSLRYAGMFAASLSRDGTTISVTAFDDKGQAVKSSYSLFGRYGSRASEGVYFGTAWAPMSTFGKYLVESLHPPILSAASCLTASTFEAGAGHRALFLLPNSFFAMNARADRQRISLRIMAALLMLPAVILAAWLSAQVTKDAAAVGFPNNARRFWVVLTLAFGLTGYITYRLTRPAMTLVTCPNCGKGRRPDMEACHHCGGKWDIPELEPPAWRVLNGAQ